MKYILILTMIPVILSVLFLSLGVYGQIKLQDAKIKCMVKGHEYKLYDSMNNRTYCLTKDNEIVKYKL